MVKVINHEGIFLAWASFNPLSQIRARIWSWKESDEINRSFIASKIKKSRINRNQLDELNDCDSFRLVHGESDGLPGLIIDKYGSYLVIQILSAGMECYRNDIVDICQKELGEMNIYERSDVDIRSLEGLEPRTCLLSGAEPPKELVINENGLKYYVDIKHGQKTGFYLDQRRNRKTIRNFSRDRGVLNCFSYTGGFTLNALIGGARHVLSIESSSEAIEIAKKNCLLNQMESGNTDWLIGDVFSELRTLRDSRQSFDLIVLDPPKFAPTVSSADKAARGYKDINLLAFKLLNPQGILFTFSCSGGISPELFQKIVADAALDAGVEARIIDRMHQAADHPVALNFPEGSYLKGLICSI